MSTDIMTLSNNLVYNGALLCGSEAVAAGKLHLPARHTAAAQLLPAWLLQVRGWVRFSVSMCR